MNAPRIVFAGTPEFACPALERLVADGHRPVAVLTQPDRPAGRGRRIAASPVKQCAVDHGIVVQQPETLRERSARADLAALAPDLIVTAAYGLLLPAEVLSLPRHGCWNLHASLLPRWRGASPIQQAILAGDRETGISLMRMDTGLDTGPVFRTRRLAIGASETAGELHDRLAGLAAEVLADALAAMAAGTLPEPVPQPEEGVTHAPRIRKSDARLDWHLPAELLARKVRAYNPWPVAFGELRGQAVRVHRARPVATGPETRAEPGTVLAGTGREAIPVACGTGVLEITELQRPGGRAMGAADWLNAHPDWR